MILDVQHTCSSRSALRNRAFLASSYFASVLLALAHSSRNSSSFQMRMYPSSWGCGGDDASLTRHFGSRSHFHTLGPTLLSFSTREPHAISGATSTPAARHGRARQPRTAVAELNFRQLPVLPVTPSLEEQKTIDPGCLGRVPSGGEL